MSELYTIRLTEGELRTLREVLAVMVITSNIIVTGPIDDAKTNFHKLSCKLDQARVVNDNVLEAGEQGGMTLQ